jgi:hypothetical protein
MVVYNLRGWVLMSGTSQSHFTLKILANQYVTIPLILQCTELRIFWLTTIIFGKISKRDADRGVVTYDRQLTVIERTPQNECIVITKGGLR